jgi:glycosyltransferase involved in cell wall biosynthesis
MAAGVPVVATAVGGIPECVVDGETGLLVRPSDSEALARAVTAALSDPARLGRLGEAGRRRLHANFTADSQVPRIEAVFHRVVSRRKRARPARESWAEVAAFSQGR